MRRNNGVEEIFEVTMAKNFPNLITDTELQIYYTQKNQARLKKKKPTPRHVFQMQKSQQKEKIFKGDTEKHLTYRRTSRINIEDLSSESKEEGNGMKIKCEKKKSVEL